MAKKPPKAAPPPPPADDFDPDHFLDGDISPIEDVAPIDDLVESEPVSVESVSDELVVVDDVVADDAIVEPDQVVPEGEPDLFGGMTGSDEPAKAADEPVEIPDDDLVIESEAATADGDDLVAADDLVTVEDDEPASTEKSVEVASLEGLEDSQFSLDDDDASPHEAETMGETAAIDEEDESAFAGVDEGVGDEELVPAAVGEEDDPTEPYYEEEIPKPKTHWFVWTLIAFNLLAALGAPYMIALAFAKRQDFTNAVFKTELIMLGLPNEEEAKSTTAARVTLPAYRIPAEEVKRIVNDRLTKDAREKPLSDPVKDLVEPYGKRIVPDSLTREILREHFAYFGQPYLEDGGEPIKTVDAEMRRLIKAVEKDIKLAAENSYIAIANDPAKQRAKIEKMLLPLAMDIYQAEKLTKLVNDTPNDKLKDLYQEAAERRMAFDLLLPLELFRPGDMRPAPVKGKDGKVAEEPKKDAKSGPEDAKGMFVESFGDLEKMPIAEVFKRINVRLESTIGETYVPAVHFENSGDDKWDGLKRNTMEKRLTMAFTMLALAHVKTPDGDPLFPKLLERIPLVMGQYDFALACELFPRGLLRINERVLDRIKIDREGAEVFEKEKDDAVKGDDKEPVKRPLLRNKRFIDYYEDELQRIRFVQHEIFKAKIRLADLESQKARYTKLLADRKDQREDVMKKIAASRAKTAKSAAELRIFQNELFRYELRLATAEEELATLYREIEQKLSRPGVGGKSP